MVDSLLGALRMFRIQRSLNSFLTVNYITRQVTRALFSVIAPCLSSSLKYKDIKMDPLS